MVASSETKEVTKQEEKPVQLSLTYQEALVWVVVYALTSKIFKRVDEAGYFDFIFGLSENKMLYQKRIKELDSLISHLKPIIEKLTIICRDGKPLIIKP